MICVIGTLGILGCIGSVVIGSIIVGVIAGGAGGYAAYETHEAAEDARDHAKEMRALELAEQKKAENQASFDRKVRLRLNAAKETELAMKVGSAILATKFATNLERNHVKALKSKVLPENTTTFTPRPRYNNGNAIRRG